MKINKDNYEMFFLDYHDGNLPAEQVAELFLFLEKNPELKTGFENFENISLLHTEEKIFPGKEALKRGFIDENNYTHYLIKSIEKTLSKHEQHMLDDFLTSFPVYYSDLRLFELTKLKPDRSILYAGKNNLKRPIPLFGGRATMLYYTTAACIVFLLGVIFIRQQDGPGFQMVQLEYSSNHAPEWKNEIPSTDAEIQPPYGISQGANSWQTHYKQFYERKAEGSKKVLYPYREKTASRKSVQTLIESGDKSAWKDKRLPDEKIAFMQPLAFTLVSEPKLLTLAGMENKEVQITYHTLTASVVKEKDFPTTREMITRISKEKLKHAINNSDLTNDLFNKHTPRKIKGIRFVGWCYEQFTGKRVNVKTTYDHNGLLTSYHISSGNFQYGKTFALK